MNHLTHDEIVLSYYDEPELGGRRDHLATCPECRAELTRLASVLDRVTPAVEVPEPADGYEDRVWERLRWKLRADPVRIERHRSIRMWLAAAAMMAVAFVGGLLWNRRPDAPPQIVQGPTEGAPTTSSPIAPVATTTPSQNGSTAGDGNNKILLVVVGEHFDQSERVLIELTNLTPSGDGVDITTERERAEELLASNRLYRRTALDRGEESVATLLDELEPVLLQIAHAPEQVSAEELRTMQKRVETKGLVFKLRVVRADVTKTARATPQPNV